MALRLSRRVLVFVVVALAWAWTSLASSGEFFFRDGDRVVIIGDSITEQHLYSNYVEMWTASRFPKWNIVFRNVGIGGDRSPGGNSRFKRDVLIHQPTAMTVDFGMNDGNYRALDENSYKTYRDGLEGIRKQADEAQIRVAWLTPSPFEKPDDGPAITGYNETLERYSAGVKEVAGDAVFVDQFHPFIEAQDRARAAAAKNRIGGGDAVHPGAPGQALMAWAILKGLSFPSLVSQVEIDAAKTKVTTSENCEVTALKRVGGGLRFERQDAALPFFPKEAEGINEWVPIRDELNQYGLKVTGLKAGDYVVQLGDAKVGTYSADQLAAGINLASAALTDGPVAEQVNKVWEAVQAKNRYYHDRVFRGVVLAPVSVPDFLEIELSAEEIEAKRTKAVEERMKALPDLDAAIRTALAPQPHLVEIVPAGK